MNRELGDDQGARNSKGEKPSQRGDMLDTVNNIFSDLNTPVPEEVIQAIENPVAAGFGMVKDELAQKAKNLASASTNAAIATKDAIQGTFSNSLEGAGELSGRVTEKLKSLVADVASKVGNDPKKESTLISEISRMGPIYGSIQDQADGWKAFHQGLEEDNEELVNEGTELTLAGWINGGMDLSAVGFVVQKSSFLVKATLMALSVSGSSKLLTGKDLRASRFIAKQLLKNSQVKSLVQGYLSLVTPKDNLEN